MRIISVRALDNYFLEIVLSDGVICTFDVGTEIRKIPSYLALYDVNFFKQVKFKMERVYWGSDYDFHIDQIMAKSTNIMDP